MNGPDDAALREAIRLKPDDAGVTLHDLGRHEQAVAAYEEVVHRYGDDPAGEVYELVAEASARRSRKRGRLRLLER